MKRRLLAIAACCACCMPAGARAQTPSVPLDQLRRPSDVPLPVPQPERPPPKLEVPVAPPAPPPAALSQGVRFLARGFRFEGNTVVTDAELQALAADFVGRELGNIELDELRVRITRRYVDAGYINSGAIVPDQDVTDGVVLLRIVEGRLSAIELSGPSRYDPEFLRARIRRGAPEVLNVERLQEHMQVMLQDPLIERISAELGPGAAPGEAVLRAEVASAPLVVATLGLSNERPPTVGAEQLDGSIAVRNLLGRGDVFSFRPYYTEGLRDYILGIVLPLTAGGTALNLRAQRTRSRIVEPPLEELDISARSRSYELGLTQPLIAQPRRSLNGWVWLARRETRSYFFGEPSPFIPGSPDGVTKVTVARLALDLLDRTPERVVAARVQVSYGLDAFGATVSGAGAPDSRFTAWLAQAHWIQRVAGTSGHFVVRGEVQRANDLLPSAERYALGGADSVRGYRKDLLVRDSGWFASVEYRHLLGHLPWYGAAAASGEGPLHLALFADTGRAWNHADPAGGTRLSGIGPGLRWEPAPGFDWQLYYGKALKNVPTPTRTAQDRGVHFRVSFARAF